MNNLALAARKLITTEALHKGKEAVPKAYVSNVVPVQNTIDIACRLIESRNPQTGTSLKR